MGTEDMDKFESEVELAKSSQMKVIGTHSDAFHCDEVLATTLLRYTRQYANSLIVRSRDESVFPKMDIICDVGGIYDAPANRFDHHQATFEESWTNNPSKDVTKLSSAGLIYKHFGKEVIANAAKDNWNVHLDDKQLNKVYEHIYESLILEVDANDNGVAVSDEPRYRVSSSLPSRVGRCNSEWNAPKEKS